MKDKDQCDLSGTSIQSFIYYKIRLNVLYGNHQEG